MLGGGIGHLTRKHGLSIDNILGAEVVLADGSVVTADESTNEDLFWAIRGGGGNFGVVTSLTLRLHPVSTVVCRADALAAGARRRVLSWYREFIPNAPEDLTGFFAFLGVAPSEPFPEELHAAERLRRRLVLDGGPAEAPTRRSPRLARSRTACSTGSRRRRSRRSRARSTSSTTRRATSGTGGPTSSRRSRTRPSSGTSSSPRSCRPGSRRCTSTRSTARSTASGATETPWAYRNANWAQVMVGVDHDPAKADEDQDLGDRLLGGATSVFGRRRVCQLHDGRRTGARSAQPTAKTTIGSPRSRVDYDPDNVFHVNQNIRPAG